MRDPRGKRHASLKNYTFTLLPPSLSFKATYGSLFCSTHPERDKISELCMKCCTSLNIYRIPTCTVDSLHSSYQHTGNLYQASPILAVTSCSLPACLSINLSVCLFTACQSFCLTPCSSPHLSEFVHANLISHNLFISPPFDLLKEACCPCFV